MMPRYQRKPPTIVQLIWALQISPGEKALLLWFSASGMKKKNAQWGLFWKKKPFSFGGLIFQQNKKGKSFSIFFSFVLLFIFLPFFSAFVNPLIPASLKPTVHIYNFFLPFPEWMWKIFIFFEMKNENPLQFFLRGKKTKEGGGEKRIWNFFFVEFSLW